MTGKVWGMNLFVLETWRQAGLAKDERGANLVALAVIAAVVFLRGQVGEKFSETGSRPSSGS